MKVVPEVTHHNIDGGLLLKMREQLMAHISNIGTARQVVEMETHLVKSIQCIAKNFEKFNSHRLILAHRTGMIRHSPHFDLSNQITLEFALCLCRMNPSSDWNWAMLHTYRWFVLVVFAKTQEQINALQSLTAIILQFSLVSYTL